MFTRTFLSLAFTLVVCAALSTSADAQATRTWVSGVGDDVNPCSRTAPCKTFAGAISKTAKSGEINCLDAGGYGAVTITKSITIDCTGTSGSILAALVTGVKINGAGAVVRLRGLHINGVGTGQNGVTVTVADKVFIENSVIDGFINHGVEVENATNVKVFVNNCSIRNNAGFAIGGVPAGQTGIWVSNSQLAGSQIGVSAGTNVTFWLSSNSITFNINGLTAQKGGNIISFGNNSIDGNESNGTPTSTAALR